jgi:hypothetical protein
VQTANRWSLPFGRSGKPACWRNKKAASKAGSNFMSIKQKLQNPFALVAQGFVAGAILLWVTTPAEAEAAPTAPLVQSAASIANAQG